MKTTDLITLQKSITQGEWKHDGAGFGNIRPVNETGRNICTFTRQFSHSEYEQVKADARAIALTPQLIAEVIRLREALDKARRGFDYTVSSMAQGHTVSISSLQNCSALCRTALENT